jgi:hypothetical protein
MQEILRFFSTEGDAALREVVRDISWKMVCYFSNWAKPNEHLLRDELVTFCLIFPSVDLAWRLGRGIPAEGAVERILALFGPDDVRNFNQFLAEKGFQNARIRYSTIVSWPGTNAGPPIFWIVSKRMGIPANAKATGVTAWWALRRKTCRVFGLMEDVIDSARGRVRRAVEKSWQYSM